jgi:hypothetical protein
VKFAGAAKDLMSITANPFWIRHWLGRTNRNIAMNPYGWVFLIASLAFVWGLTIWCFYRVLTAPAEDGDRGSPS